MIRPLTPASIPAVAVFRFQATYFFLRPLLALSSVILFSLTIVADVQEEYEKLAETILQARNDQERKGLLVVKHELEVALVSLGKRLHQEGRYEDALVAYNSASNIADQLGDRQQVAFISGEIGEVYSVQGKYRLALEHYEKGLQFAQQGQDREQIASAHIAIGSAHYWLGEYESAFNHYRSSLSLATELHHAATKASALLGIGLVHYARGDYQQALRNYGQVLKYEKDIGDVGVIAEASVNIGILHYKQGDYDQALVHYRKALRLFEKLGDKESLVSVLHNIGQVRQKQADYGRALENYRRGLGLSEGLGNKPFISRGLLDIGYLYYEQRQFTKALLSYQKALTIAEEAGTKEDLSIMLIDLANANHSLGNFQEALQYANRAARVAQEVGSLESLWRANTTEGRAYKSLGEPARSAQAFDQAIAIIEQLRGQVAGGQQEQQRFFENKTVPYHEAVDLMVSRHDLVTAFSYAERAKSRVLLDLFTRGAMGFGKVMSQEEQAEDRQLKGRIASLNVQIYGEVPREPSSGDRTASLNAQLQKARLEYEAFRTTLVASQPALKAPEPNVISLSEAGELIGNRDTALLEYVVLDERTYLFLTTRTASGAARLRAYPIPVKENQLARSVVQLRDKITGHQTDFHPLAMKLHQLLLGPAQPQLKGVSTLCIVPDGILWELPFQALQPTENQYLLERFAVFYAPSLTVLRQMQRLDKMNRGLPQGKQPMLLAFANVQSTLGQTRIGPSGGSGTERLDLSEWAVQEIAKVYGSGRSTIYTRSSATEAIAKSEMGKYQVLHFFTHGLLDNRRPSYSALMLSPGGSGSEDGMLEAWEVMQLKLNADLAVLSACETAGRAGSGEGLIGMSWAFLVAGCPSTVVSQWKVGAVATKELMVEFHRQLAQPGQTSLSKAQALRRAALKVRNTTLLEHPYSWAGFVLVGSSN